MAESLLSESDIERIIRDAFEKTHKFQIGGGFTETLQAGWAQTPVGPILMAADSERLHLLSFIEQASMLRKAVVIQKNLRARIELGDNPALDAVERELDEYFAGQRRRFDIPIALNGTAFQTTVWEALRQIPYGETVSYVDLAQRIGKPAAFRAVAQANAQTPINIIIPCHRVINTDGGTGGFSAGSERKRRLLDFERSVVAVTVPASGG